jgi:predicted RNA methylase
MQRGKGKMKIDNDVLQVLDNSSVDGNILFLPPTQLERNLYQKVNKVLECLGGKWNRSKRGHVFDTDPSEMIEEAILTGEVTDAKKEFQFFETPKDIVLQMIELAELNSDDDVLEPSAGRGAIVDRIGMHNPLTIIELNPENADALRQKGYSVIEEDFLNFDISNKHSKIIMNPPFSKQQDIDHVLHAWKCLKDNGILVSIMSEGTFFRDNKKAVAFRDLLDEVGYSIPLDEGTFKESGTMVKTRIVVMKKQGVSMSESRRAS